MHWNNYKYRKEVDRIIIEEYEGEERHVVIPSEIDGLPVKKIEPEAFSSHGALIETIEVPGTVTEIGDGAFKMCMNLEKLILQDGVQRIGENVLLVTAVTEMYLPASVSELVRPWEWGKIALEVAPDNPNYFSDGYGLYEKHPEGYALVAVWAEDGRECYEVVPGTVCVKQHAFEGQMYIQQVVLPEGVQQIEEEAFESCQALQRISLPEGLTQLGADAFRCCIKLEGIELPASLKSLGEHALTDTYGWSPSMNGIQYITVQPENPYFYNDAYAFYRRGEHGDTLIKYFGKNETWKIPKEVTEVGSMALRRANLREVTIPETVKKLPKDAFQECGRLECMEIEADQVKLYVPENPVYRKVEISGLFYQDADGNLQYDYAAYDALLQEWSQILIRCRMAAFRLEYPMQLKPVQKAAYQALISEHLKELVYDICKRESLKDLEALGRAGIITEANIEDMIAWTTECHRGKLTGYLMEYQSEHLGADEFDFSL
ncbi:leucine-rich repeat domain-containing protein [uncultured Eubacterium sp.]|uniref:leucine-rich repeat domain-containing protein n=1 Tax=uncultured Eubacterium sp. TaxID=165185 RepID=UPI0025E16540|nr:leucine-rich repeat domain-containing protein [uncultured Eubacterium sp.]